MYIEKDIRVLKPIAKKYDLSFCEVHRYYEGNANTNNKGKYLPSYFTYNNRVYTLKYFSGCFNPYLVGLTGKFWYNKETNEPLFKYEANLTPLHLDKIYCK